MYADKNILFLGYIISVSFGVPQLIFERLFGFLNSQSTKYLNTKCSANSYACSSSFMEPTHWPTKKLLKTANLNWISTAMVWFYFLFLLSFFKTFFRALTQLIFYFKYFSAPLDYFYEKGVFEPGKENLKVKRFF